MKQVYRISLAALLLLFARPIHAQNFEFGYGIGLNWSILNVYDSTAGRADSVYGNSFLVESVPSTGYSFMAYGLYHINKRVSARVTAGADWISGKISLGRAGVGGNLVRIEEQYFEGWFHLAPGIQYTQPIIPDLLSITAGVDLSLGLAAINLQRNLPTTDTISVRRDYYTLTSVNSFLNGFNVFVRPHVQLNFIRKSGRKWTASFQYDQGLMDYFQGRSNGLTYLDPYTLQPVLRSGYFVQGRASRFTFSLGAELPWGHPTRKKPQRQWIF